MNSSNNLDVFNRKFRDKLLNLFNFTIDFLNQHNLRWWVAYGTALGTARHKGLIPWDDDIDIYMPREDYEKLFCLREELLSTNYDLASLHDKGYYLYFGKIFDKTTSIWEVHRFPFVIGVYIDIFPLDTVSECDSAFVKDNDKIQYLYKQLQSFLSRIYIQDIWVLLKGLHLGTIKSVYGDILKYRTNNSSIQKEYEEAVNRIVTEEGNFYSCVTSELGLKEHYPKQWFEEYSLMPFEGFEVRAPIEIEKYLTKIYGDWRTPPPLREQIPHHGQYYVNLNEGLTIEEIKKRMNKGKNREY